MNDMNWPDALERSTDMVNHPPHYTSHPSGVECIEINEHLPANCAAAFKYLFRHKHKGAEKQDIEKAQWYIRREISRIEEGRFLESVKVQAVTDHEPDWDIAQVLYALTTANPANAYKETVLRELRRADSVLTRYMEKKEHDKAA